MQLNKEKVVVMKYFGPKMYDNFEKVFFGKPDLMIYRVLIESSHNHSWLNFENQQAPYPCMAPISNEGSIFFYLSIKQKFCTYIMFKKTYLDKVNSAETRKIICKIWFFLLFLHASKKQ